MLYRLRPSSSKLYDRVAYEENLPPEMNMYYYNHAFRKKKVPIAATPQPAVTLSHEVAPRTRTVLMAGNWKMNPTSVKVGKTAGVY